MDHYSIFAGNCQGTLESLAMAVDALAEPLSVAAGAVTNTLLQDGKIMACGTGADAALAQLFCINMLGQFHHERPALPAMTLAADGGTLATISGLEGHREIFARQVRALGQPGDVLLCLASGTAGEALLGAVEAARERNMLVVALSNGEDDNLLAALREGDVRLAVHSPAPARALELHTVLIQNLCELVDHNLFGG
ncbi:D-sedoheptulose-7-phosphate isomerase [Parahaliea mediterranea]|uniref:SIS domain-containing protein n=1 Tax=Parahaliea mediterranea TaxID=651086 RepID=A0A939DBY5_9GAMM|nr:SIS domain-containing protein [Parahaliea mediterranea]MBN7795365.1 SIS domain-containing protein [Parahaliea mediterranea]